MLQIVAVQSAANPEFDSETKARVLVALEGAFGGHSVPNSLLHRIETLDHAFRYYSAQVDTRTPYEKLHAEQVRY